MSGDAVNWLDVRVVEGRNIVLHDGSQPNELRCRVRVGAHRLATKACKGTTAPKWSEDFALRMNEAWENIEFAVVENPKFKREVVLGTVSIRPLQLSVNKITDQWFAVPGLGKAEVRLRVLWKSDDSDDDSYGIRTGTLPAATAAPIALMPGETVRAQLARCALLLGSDKYQSERYDGRIVLTNFRCAVITASPDTTLECPLTTVYQLSRVGNERRLRVLTKHMSQFTVDLSHLPEKGFDRFHRIMQHSFFPSSYEATFAFHNVRRFEGMAGWDAFDMEAEYRRQGVPNSKWRLSRANADYSLCPSYPPLVAVPASFSEHSLHAVARFRSKGRIPALTWMHPTGKCAIARCSQPMTGIKKQRSPQDEEMVGWMMGQCATRDLYIVDARPRINAIGNQAKGAGSEDAAQYKCKFLFVGIENIHVMRKSYARLHEAVRRYKDDTNWLSELNSSDWLVHVSTVLSGSVRIVQIVESGTAVLVHCSDGWDRTAQLCATAQLMMDPFYRTFKGFAVLVEKDWLAFGHKFAHRLNFGHNGSSEEDSPVFVQWIDAVWQMMEQCPTAFEFNELYLIELLDQLFSCRFGTFAYNCVRERAHARLHTSTPSVWAYLATRAQEFTNPYYRPATATLHVRHQLRNLSVWRRYYFRDTNAEVCMHDERDQLFRSLLARIAATPAGQAVRVDDLAPAFRAVVTPVPVKEVVVGRRALVSSNSPAGTPVAVVTPVPASPGVPLLPQRRATPVPSPAGGVAPPALPAKPKPRSTTPSTTPTPASPFGGGSGAMPPAMRLRVPSGGVEPPPVPARTPSRSTSSSSPTSPKPASPGPKPASPGPKPASPGPKPASPGPKPASPGPKSVSPVSPGVKPAAFRANLRPANTSAGGDAGADSDGEQGRVRAESNTMSRAARFGVKLKSTRS